MTKMLRSISIFRLRFHSLYSTTSSPSLTSDKITATPSTNFMVDYLMDVLGFHEKEALSVTSKVSHLKSIRNLQSVVNIFKDYGLDNAQIRDIVFFSPKILTVKAYKTLEPKIRFFQELGLSESDLVKLIKKNPTIANRGLQNQIIPSVEYFRKFLGSDEKVVAMINKSRWLPLTNNARRRMSENILLMQNFGLSSERISWLLVYYPEIVRQPPELIESKFRYTEEKLGIYRDSPIFVHGVNAVLWSNESETEKKIEIFRSFGWSDSDIATLLRAQPYCLSKSESYIRDKLNFFMKELGYKPSNLSTKTAFWTLSLEKRLKTRNEVLKILKEKKLVKEDHSLYSIVSHSELKFLDRLRRFECDIPGLCERYLNCVNNCKL